MVDAIKNGGIQLVFNTTEGAQALADSRSLRRAALLHKVPYYTTLAGALAAAQGVQRLLRRRSGSPGAAGLFRLTRVELCGGGHLTVTWALTWAAACTIIAVLADSR